MRQREEKITEIKLKIDTLEEQFWTKSQYIHIVKVCLHISSPSTAPSQFNIVLMVMYRFIGKNGFRTHSVRQMVRHH